MKLTFNQLLVYNVHIGHGKKNTLLFSSWMLYGKRQNLYIIDLKITFFMFRFAFKLIKFIVKSYGPFWFINLDKSMKQIVENAAYICGEFGLGGVWYRGLVTNFHFTVVNIKQDYLRKSWPRGLFVSSAFYSSIVIKECGKGTIPCISIADTNVKSYGINLVIPGNDEGADCIIFYNLLIANLILKEKFYQMVLWHKIFFKKSLYHKTIWCGVNVATFFMRTYSKSNKFFFSLWSKRLNLLKGYVFLENMNRSIDMFLNCNFGIFLNLKTLFWIQKGINFIKYFVSKRKKKRFYLRSVKRKFEFSLKNSNLNIKKNFFLYLKAFFLFRLCYHMFSQRSLFINFFFGKLNWKFNVK